MVYTSNGFYSIEGVSDEKRMNQLKDHVNDGDSYMSKNGLWEFVNGEWKIVWIKLGGVNITESEYIQLQEEIERDKEDDQSDRIGYNSHIGRGNY